MSHTKQHNRPSASKPTTAAAKPEEAATDSSCCQPIDEGIRQRAYEICQARNGGPGNATTDWAQAEKELAAKGTMG